MIMCIVIIEIANSRTSIQWLYYYRASHHLSRKCMHVIDVGLTWLTIVYRKYILSEYISNETCISFVAPNVMELLW